MLGLQCYNSGGSDISDDCEVSIESDSYSSDYDDVATDNDGTMCDNNIDMMVYSCVHSYEICELLHLFGPSLIAENDITVVRRGWP